MTTMINKVVYGQAILLDLTSDTVAAAHLDSGYTAHDASGATITGTSTKDADTSDGTASAADILSGKTAYAGGAKLTGTMANRGAVSGTISTVAGSYTVPAGYHAGYHDGNGSVTIDSAEQAKIIPANIAAGVSILGIQGSLTVPVLTPVIPNGTNITHFWLPKTVTRPICQITYEDKTNTRSDEYVVQSGKLYLARFIQPYGAWCEAAFSTDSLIERTTSVSNCSVLAPIKWHDDIYFVAPMNGYLIMYKDDTGNDSFLSECFEVNF